jgi:ribosomal protein S18
MVLGGLLGGLGGFLLQKKLKGGPAPAPENVPKQFPQGTANYYDDSYKPLLDYLQGLPQDSGTAGAYKNVLGEFKGSQQNLRDFLQIAAPFMASGLGTTGAFKDLQNYQGRSNLLQQYGTQAGKINQSAQAGLTQANQQLGRSGLGNAAAQSQLASQAALGAGGQRSDLYTGLYQQQLASRQQYAQQAFDAHRLLATLALGHNPLPRTKQQSQDFLPALASSIGGVAGTALGAAIG